MRARVVQFVMNMHSRFGCCQSTRYLSRARSERNDRRNHWRQNTTLSHEFRNAKCHWRLHKCSAYSTAAHGAHDGGGDGGGDDGRDDDVDVSVNGVLCQTEIPPASARCVFSLVKDDLEFNCYFFFIFFFFGRSLSIVSHRTHQFPLTNFIIVQCDGGFYRNAHTMEKQMRQINLLSTHFIGKMSH